MSGQSLGFSAQNEPNRLPGDGVVGEGLNGVHGVAHTSGGAGVWGENTSGGAGVHGTSQSGDAVIGVSSSSAHAGVSAINDSGGFGVWARGTPAGHFEGDVEVTGDITLLGPGQDCAEDFDISDAEDVDPGDGDGY